MECKFAMKIQDFPYRLCKLQQEAPVGCNLLSKCEECQVLKEYNMSKSAQHPTSEGENVR